MLSKFAYDRRGVVELVVALVLAIGSLFLPAVQKDAAFNRTAGPAQVVAQP